MIPEKQKGYIYYRCHTPTCRGNCIKQEQLDKAVLDNLARTKLQPADIETITSAVMLMGQRDPATENKNTISMRLRNIDDRLEKLDDAAIERIIDREVHALRKEKLLLERSKVISDQSKIETNALHPAMLRKFLERIKTLVEHLYFIQK